MRQQPDNKWHYKPSRTQKPNPRNNKGIETNTIVTDHTVSIIGYTGRPISMDNRE